MSKVIIVVMFLTIGCSFVATKNNRFPASVSAITQNLDINNLSVEDELKESESYAKLISYKQELQERAYESVSGGLISLQNINSSLNRLGK